MASGGNIGSVTITVEADASDVPGDVEKAATGLSGVGERLGRIINSGIEKGLKGSLQSVVSSAQSTLTNGRGKAGEAASGMLTRALGPKLASTITGFVSSLTTAEGRLNLLGNVGTTVGGKIASALGPKI